MRKTRNLLVLLMMVLVLFSCESNTKEPPEKGYKDFVILWDNVGNDIGRQDWTMGHAIVSELDPDFSISRKVEHDYQPGDLNTMTSFTITEERDIYFSEYEFLGWDKGFNLAIKKYPYQESGNGTHASEAETILKIGNYEYPYFHHINDIAVSGNKIYYAGRDKGSTPFLHVYDMDSKTDSPILEDGITDLIPTAMEALSDGSILLAAKNKTQGNDIELYRITSTEEGYQLSEKQTFDFLPGKGNEYMTDMQVLDGSVYAIIANSRFNSGVKPEMGGGIVRLAVVDGKIVQDEKFGKEGVFGYDATLQTEKWDLSVCTKYDPACESFYFPMKFVALKPKQLVIADEGIYMEGESPKEANSVVYVDINKGTPSFNKRVTLNNVSFSQNDYISISGYIDMIQDY